MAKHHAETINKMFLKGIQYRSTSLNDLTPLTVSLSTEDCEATPTFGDVAAVSDHNQYNISRPEGVGHNNGMMQMSMVELPSWC